ncbi:MAG: hypothetical protein H6974_16225 [Gammaproteobacteria bacterium]|nr:hypothetical protein [Gammaproteobacteria bacterium]
MIGCAAVLTREQRAARLRVVAAAATAATARRKRQALLRTDYHDPSRTATPEPLSAA